MKTYLPQLVSVLVLWSFLATAEAQRIPQLAGQDQSNPPGQESDDTAASDRSTETLKVNVDVVQLFFNVKDKKGGLIPNLTKNDFDLLEDGKPQTIKYFSAESNLPLTLGILIDSSGSMQNMLPEEKVVGADFLRQVITDKDLAFIISFDINVDLLQDLTSDVHLLREGLDKARTNVGAGSGGIPGIGQGPVPVSRPKGTLLYDGLYLASDEILSKQVGRKAMVVLTDGVDQGSRLRLKDAIEAAQKADAICYVLLISDVHWGSDSHDMGEMAEQ